MRKLHLIVMAAAVALCAWTSPKPASHGFQDDFETYVINFAEYCAARIHGSADTTAKAAILWQSMEQVRTHGDIESNLKATYGIDWQQLCFAWCAKNYLECALHDIIVPMCASMYIDCIIWCPKLPKNWPLPW
jgi:hypothetical protein